MTEDPQVQTKKQPWWKVLVRVLFSHVGLFILVSAYGAVGAWLFVRIELPAEEKRYELKKLKARDIQDAMTYLSSLFWYYKEKNFTMAEWNKNVMSDLNTLSNFVLQSASEFNYDGKVEGWDYSWTFSKALLFTITIMSTVGYGHISPVTFMGKIFTILYAIIGIPLLLVFLANIGDSMAEAFKYTYSRCCCRWCRARRKDTEAGGGRPEKRLKDETVGVEEYMPTDSVLVPIILNLIIIGVYILCGAVIFSVWEKWDLASASYFTFITLSTVGFGDMVPGNSFLGDNDGVVAAMKMLTTVLYCVFGMALVSMCINLMQEQLVLKMHWAAKEIGIVQEENEEAHLAYIKRSRKGEVKETPGEKKKKKKKKKKKVEDKLLDINEVDEEKMPEDPKPEKPSSAAIAGRTSRPQSSMSQVQVKE